MDNQDYPELLPNPMTSIQFLVIDTEIKSFTQKDDD